jgi:hypothetical protein
MFGGLSIHHVAEQRPPSAPATNDTHAEVAAVSPEYFRTIGIPLRLGRAFTLADRDTVNGVAIVSERMVSEYWGGRSPIGTRISAVALGGRRHRTRHNSLAGGVRQD